MVIRYINTREITHEKLLLRLFILLPFVSCAVEKAQETNQELVSLYASRWEFMQERFIAEPRAICKYSLPELRKCASFVLPFLVTTAAFTKFVPAQGYPLSLCYSLWIFFLLQYLAYASCSAFDDYLLNYVGKNQVIKFIAHWERNKKYSPREMHEFFDEIYNDYQKNPHSIKSDLAQIVKRVKIEIEKHKSLLLRDKI